MTSKRLRPLLLLAATTLFAVPACTSHDDGADHSGHDASAPEGSVGCATDPRVTVFATGMQAKSASGKLVAEIVNATPSPPQRGSGDAGINAWTVKLTLDGAPPAAKDIQITTLMPDHGHGSPKTPVLTANPDGTYAVNDLFFFMAGVWEIIFSTNGQEPATFTICVQ